MRKSLYKRSFLAIFLQILHGFILFSFIPLASAEPAKLAIVIDDIGYRNREDSAIYALPQEVAVAIIPASPFATARANKAHDQKRDILIHLPMQPQGNHPIESGALMVGMDSEKVSRLVQSSRNQVPYAIGLNNHMGSRATTDKALMQQLMKALSQNQLFFLDSKTAGNSVAAKTAKEYSISALERHIFLDDSDELADVQKQFSAALAYARKHGVAIMIGHPRKNSIAVLEKGLANLPTDIQLVSIGSLWRGETVQPEKPFIMLFDIEPALTSNPPFDAVPLLRGVPKE